MLKPSESQTSTSTDRAVTISAIVLLAAILGFFACRHLSSKPDVGLLTAGSQPAPAPASDLRSSPAEVQPVVLEVRPVEVRAALVSSGSPGSTVEIAAHAPLELTPAGRAAADPLAFAPRALPEHGAQELMEELTKAPEMDLYGAERDARQRFADIQQDVAAQRNQFAARATKLDARARRGELGRRRARTDRGRREMQAELTAALFGSADPFKPQFEPLKRWMDGRRELNGLPMAMGDECRLDSIEADDLQTVSEMFREFRRNALSLPDDAAKQEALLNAVAQQRWQQQHIPGLMQVLTAEAEPLRLELVRTLSSLNYPAATVALARLATFDLSADVRRQAVAELQGRRREEYRDTLLAGLRYVWPPAADNAASALVALDDREAYDALAALSRQGDPRAPHRTADGHWAVSELVRVNHMRNCLLCHAPAVAGNARVTGTVPSPYEPLPREYYESSSFLARADVTYLRQDFSVVHAVQDHRDWPVQQRFDYLVRERRLTAEEATELTSQYAGEVYPQQAAVLYALRKLRGDKLSASR